MWHRLWTTWRFSMWTFNQGRTSARIAARAGLEPRSRPQDLQGMAPMSMNSHSPVVGGGTGGSGTRAFAHVVACAGIDIGTNLNESLDAMSFERFLDLWINRYLVRSIAPLSPQERASMSQQLDKCVEEHRSTNPMADRWGFKNPRNMFLLPFLDEEFPEMKFIHVIRDGRAMAFDSDAGAPRALGFAVHIDRLSGTGR